MGMALKDVPLRDVHLNYIIALSMYLNSITVKGLGLKVHHSQGGMALNDKGHGFQFIKLHYSEV